MDSASRKQSGNDYDQLLARARESQAAVDRAIEELRQIQRFLSDGPAIIASRKQAADQAQKALLDAEHKVATARESMSEKQVEVARLMETAAGCQQAMARSLSPGQPMPDYDPPAQPVNLDPKPDASTSSKSKSREKPGLLIDVRLEPVGAAWGKTYAFPTGQVREQEDDSEHGSDVVEFLRDRDVLCPSCGTPLRGVEKPSCRNCRMHLSLAVLKTTGPRGSTRLMWMIRLIAVAAVLMCMYLTFSTVTGKPLIGCGRGSSCDRIFTSGYATLLGIPIAVFGAGIYLLLAFATFFTGIGQRDQTRRRGWTWLSLLAALAVGSATWSIFLQVVVLRGACPHCLLVDLAGLVIAVLVFKNAPLIRPEKVPADAVGTISVSKKATLSLATIAVFSLALFIGAHSMFKGESAPITSTGPIVPKEKNNGLMMGGLDLDPRNRPDKSNEDNNQAKTKSPTPPAKTDDKDKAKDSDKTKDGSPATNGLLFKPPS